MSKRFGRNQRRKLREEIATERRANLYWVERSNEDRRLYNEQLNRRVKLENEMSEWARRIARAMPVGSPFVRKIDAMILSRGADPRYLRSTHRQSVKLADLMLSPDVFPETVSEAIIDLFSITCDVYDDTLAMRRMVRIEIPSGDRRTEGSVFGYAMDVRTLHEMRADPRFVGDYLGEKLIRDFTRAWGELGKKSA